MGFSNSDLLGGSDPHKTKLYWFIPDGLRAEPDVFQIYQWAQEGKLPHIRKMMEKGTYGYSIPVFPGHTPANFATLFTGLLPRDHGVADGPLRDFGYPLKIVSRSGFSSSAKEKDPIWYTLEKRGFSFSLLSVPGSTPPEISNGNIVKGRWGGWGVEFPSVIFQSTGDPLFRKNMGRNERTFNVGKRLTNFIEASVPKDWIMPLPKSYSGLKEVSFKNWQGDLFGLMIDEVNDGKVGYTSVLLSIDKKQKIAQLKEGEWSDWITLDLYYPIQKSYQDEHPQKMAWEQNITQLKMPTKFRVMPIRLRGEKDFRFRVLYDSLNESLTYPSTLAHELESEVGPMVDFPDDFPPQLIYFPEDKKVFMDESRFSFDWHQKALKFLFKNKTQDIFIHNIYTPNQMLTSRWWMAYADPASLRYGDISSGDREQIWNEILQMYKRIDDMLGVAMAQLPKDAYLVFSSDHGVAPLNTEVRLNNFFAQKGWLRFVKDKESEVLMVDWKNTKVVFLQSNHVYINAQGLDGAYQPAKGAAHTAFVSMVRDAIASLRDKDDEIPFLHVYTRAEAVDKLGLPARRIGDLVLSHQLGYSAAEDMSEDLILYSTPLKSGYKQGLNPVVQKSLWTPLMVMGPGVKEGLALKEPVSHLDQYPMIMELLKEETPLKIKSGELKAALPRGSANH